MKRGSKAAAKAELLDAVYGAHAACVVRADGALPCSSAAVLNAWHGSRDYAKAIAAGLMTLGEVHGPIVQAYEFLTRRAAEGTEATEKAVVKYLKAGAKIPGWGNAFVRGDYDPAWHGVDDVLSVHFMEIHDVLMLVTHALHAAGKKIYPNAAAYTAAAAMALGMPKEIAPALFVRGRLEEWGKLIVNHGATESTEGKP